MPRYFNPRLREGGDDIFVQCLHRYLHFNPRLREGGDPRKIAGYVRGRDFNPRLREGGDTLILKEREVGVISIHASEKEATATYCDTSAITYISSLNNFFVRYF